MKKIYILLLLSLVVTLGNAKNRTDSQMRAIAERQLSFTSSVAKARGDKPIDVSCQLSKPTLNVYSGENGFVVVSRDDCFPEVLAYGSGKFDVATMPDATEWWLEAVQICMQNASGLLKREPIEHKVVAPLLTTKWGQGPPFNNYAPIFKKDKTKAPSGCVAIAMAQVMNFNKYPESAKFTGSYSVSDDPDDIETVSVNSTYQWPYLDAYSYYFPEGSSEYKTVDSTPRQGNAIATLCRDCGYAVGMQYNPSGSGAFTADVAQKLIDIFKYSEVSVSYFYRPLYSEREWMSIIYDELSKGYPFIYSGHSEESGGHAFVADGVDAEGLLHINWGWSGQNDGYYDFRLLNPEGEGGFYDSQQVVTGIRPEALESDTYGSSLYTPAPFKLSYDNEKRTMTVYEYGIYNWCGKRIVGDVGILFENMTNPEKSDTLSFPLEGEPLEMNYGWGEGEDVHEWEFAPGNYRVYLASKDVHETEWQMGRVPGLGAFYYEMTVDEDKNVIIGAEPVSTGIESILFNATTNNHYQLGDNIYDLNGRMVGNSDAKHQKGIFIVNGKKVLK